MSAASGSLTFQAAPPARLGDVIWKYTGAALIALAVGHTLFGAAVYAFDGWALIAPGQDDTAENWNALVWFWFAGIPLGLWGWTAHWAIRETGRPLPRSIGIATAILGFGCWPLWPISGFPLAGIIGIAIAATGPERATG